MARDIILEPLPPENAKPSAIAGFDTETYDSNRGFVLGSISWGPQPGLWVDPEIHEFYYSREELVRRLEQHSTRDYSVWASNMEFDFFTASDGTIPRGWELFHNGAKWMRATFSTREECTSCKGKGCHRLGCKCKKPYCSEGRCKCGQRQKARVTIYDSFNIYRTSVEEMGNILLKVSAYWDTKGDREKAAYFKVAKMERPKWIGQKSLEEMSEADLRYLMEYNLTDSVVTRKFVEFMQVEFGELGSMLRSTTPGIAMDLWRRKHLKTTYKKPHRSMNGNARNAYFGGRTEVFWFGYSPNVYGYDVKSMYPWAMKNTAFPDPNTLAYFPEPTRDLIQKEGVSRVTLHIPEDSYIPPIPERNQHLGKVIFPVGTLTGVYTNLDIRYALAQGATLLAHEWSIVSEESVKPFDTFIDELWNLRARFLAESNPANLIVKLAMNSLYGKFGMNEEKDNVYIYASILDDDSDNLFEFTDAINTNLTARGILLRPIEDKPDFPFVNLFWASYVTSRARCRIHSDAIRAIGEGRKVFYKDTDSLYTDGPLSWPVDDEKGQLGDLCFKGLYAGATFIAPKFYILENTPDEMEKKAAKAKKAGKKDKTPQDFRFDYYAKGLPPEPREGLRQALLNGELHFEYTKFMRAREAWKREGVKPNEIVPTHKTFQPLARPKRCLVEPVTNIRTLADRMIDSRPWNTSELVPNEANP